MNLMNEPSSITRNTHNSQKQCFEFGGNSESFEGKISIQKNTK